MGLYGGGQSRGGMGGYGGGSYGGGYGRPQTNPWGQQTNPWQRGQNYGMRPQTGAGPGGSQVMSKPFSVNEPQVTAGGQTAISDPYRDYSPQAPQQALPSQPFMPGAPQSKGQDPYGLTTGGNPMQSFTQQAQMPQMTGDPVADQRAMDAYNQQQFTNSAKVGGAAPPVQMPPQPSQMQPGQNGWVWGNNPVTGQVRTDYSQSWQPQYTPGAKEYINYSLNRPDGGGLQPWASQINWGGDVMGQIGNFTGNPFNPSRWSY